MKSLEDHNRAFIRNTGLRYSEALYFERIWCSAFNRSTFNRSPFNHIFSIEILFSAILEGEGTLSAGSTVEYLATASGRTIQIRITHRDRSGCART